MTSKDSNRPKLVPAKSSGVDAAYNTLIQSVRDYAIFILDPSGHITSWNRGAQLIKGYTAEDIIGQHFSRFYPAAAVERGWPDHELNVARNEGRFEDEGWRVRKDGSTFWAHVIITALRDDRGTLIGYGKITHDLTERRREQESLRQSEERFRLLVEGVKDYGIFMLDVDGRIMSWNTGAERIKGYSAKEIIGRHFSLFYPPELIAADWPAHELRIARTEGRYEEEAWRVRKDGSRFWASVIISAIRDHTGELRGYAKVTRDLTQRQRMEQLQEASRQMSDFVAMLAHELRNPLAPIRNAMQVMALRGLEDPQLEWCRTVVDRQIAHLGRLVDDLLDVNRVTTGKIQLKCELVPIALVLERALESSSPLIQERKHHVEISFPEEPLLLHADPTRLAQVFLNLLNNAAKYTPANGLIQISGKAEAQNIVVRVRDNGVGIAPDLLPKVFDLFVQGSRSLDRAEGGLGIGLTLVREIVRLHGGSVSVSSGGVQQGTQFTVKLPLVTRTRDQTRNGHGTDEPASSARQRRILVVDDNSDSAESMALLLRASGHDVHTAHDGASALEQADAHKPEIVLLDIGLPGISGYTVAKRLRELPGLSAVKLIAMTGYGQEDDRKRSRDAGFDHHLVKPVDLAVLAALLT
ncbi:MAG TPA: PAS domain S-box protein [Burkholderiales bacterium]